MIPTITPLPRPVPTTADPDNFDQRADAFLAALPTMVEEEIAAITATNVTAAQMTLQLAAAQAAQAAAEAAMYAAVGAGPYAATSLTPLSLTPGAKAIAFAEAGRTFADGQMATLIRTGDPNQRMRGTVSLADMGAKTMTVTVAASGITGAGGPYADWLVILSALEAESPALSTARAIAFAAAL